MELNEKDIAWIVFVLAAVLGTYIFTIGIVATTATESFDDLCYVNGYYGFKNIEEFPGGFMVTCEEEDLRFPQGVVEYGN